MGVLVPAAAAAFLLLVLWAQPLTTIDRLFLPDDTYYTLSIARALSAGDGPSASGGILTSGFQPLTAFLMVPVFWHLGWFGDVMMAALTLGTLAFGFGAVGFLGSASGVVLSMLMAVQAAIRDRRILPEAVLAVASAALLVFYVAHLPALWFFERYFYPVFVTATLCGTIAIWRLWMRGSAPARAATGLLMGGLLTANVVGLVPYHEAAEGVAWLLRGSRYPGRQSRWGRQRSGKGGDGERRPRRLHAAKLG